MTFNGPGFLLEVVDEIDDLDDLRERCEHGEEWDCCEECGCHCETRGTVSWAPAGTDPLDVSGWTELGWTTDGISLAGDDVEAFSYDADRMGKWSATIEVPHISRETIALAMGLDADEQLAPKEPWPPKPTLLEQLGIPVIESPWVPPGQVIIGAHGLGARIWPPEPRERDWWEDGMWAYRAVERIAMQVQRPYGLTVKSSVPTIGLPPRKSRGLTGRRYRTARRAYARKRRAWIRQGSPTYPTQIHMPSVILTGIDIT